MNKKLQAQLAGAKEKLTEKSIQSVGSSKDEVLTEALQNLQEARFKIVNRVRKGKVERRRKVSTQKGYTFRGGKLTKMSAAEKMRRKVSQRRAAKKRSAKASRSKIKQQRSRRLRKRTFGR